MSQEYYSRRRFLRYSFSFPKVKDGRKVGITNSGFGTVFRVAEGKPKPVCDYGGFAPFGFSYHRCPGEQLTIQVFEDFLRKVWRDKIVFLKLNLINPGRVPIGPNAVIVGRLTNFLTADRSLDIGLFRFSPLFFLAGRRQT